MDKKPKPGLKKLRTGWKELAFSKGPTYKCPGCKQNRYNKCTCPSALKLEKSENKE